MFYKVSALTSNVEKLRVRTHLCNQETHVIQSSLGASLTFQSRKDLETRQFENLSAGPIRPAPLTLESCPDIRGLGWGLLSSGTFWKLKLE